MVLYAGKLRVRRELLPKLYAGAAMDRGGSMTKVGLVRKGTDKNSEYVDVEFYAFPNDAFEEALDYIKQNAELVVDPNLLLPATGIGTTRYQQHVRDTLGLGGMTQFNEFNSQVHGITFLANNYDHSEFTCKLDNEYIAAHKLANLKLYDENSTVGQLLARHKSILSSAAKTAQDTKEEIAREKAGEVPDPVSQCKHLPALLCVGGSAFPIAIMDEELLIAIFLGGINVGGRTFLGLCNLIVGTKNYAEVCEWAAAAKKREQQRHKEKKEKAKDKYEELNQAAIDEFPLDPSRTSAGREETALGLIQLFASMLAEGLAAAVAQTNLTTIYLTGGFFMHELIRNELVWRLESLLPADLTPKVYFMQNTSLGVVGSFLCADALQKDSLETDARLQEVMAAMAAEGGAPPHL